MKAKLLMLCVSAMLTFLTCKKANVSSDVVKKTIGNNFTTGDIVYTSNQPRNLNLVYFVPNDLDTLPAYQKRISDLISGRRTSLKMK